MRCPTSNWDFWTQLPEALHQVTYLMGDRGIPANYRQMHGYGSHTFSLINANNERFWVKFHLRSQQGIANLSDAEAAEVIGKDRESSQRDLYDAIEKGDYPRWKMYIQVMPEADAVKSRFNPFDLTKVWSKKEFPLIEVGHFELNKNPDSYFADVEQAAFNPAHIVPGIGFSPDRMLQGRLFSYGDAQRYRLGVNHYQIPVNKPRCPFTNFHRDGAMRVDGNAGSTISYEPNTQQQWQQQEQFAEPPLQLDGYADRFDFWKDEPDYFTQAGDLFRLMSSDEQQRLFDNTARNMEGVSDEIKRRHIEHCRKADPAYGEGLAKAMGLN